MPREPRPPPLAAASAGVETPAIGAWMMGMEKSNRPAESAIAFSAHRDPLQPAVHPSAEIAATAEKAAPTEDKDGEPV